MTVNVTWRSGWSNAIGTNPTWRAIQRAWHERDAVKYMFIVFRRVGKPWLWVRIW
jgi:hypothetical protein